MGRFGTTAHREYIYVYYSHQDKKFRVSTGMKVTDPRNPNPPLLPRDPLYKEKQNKITEVMQDLFTADTRLRTARIYPDVHAMRREYYKVVGAMADLLDETKYKPFWNLFDQYMKTKKATRATTTINNYNQFKATLKGYESYDGYETEFNTFDNVQFGRYIQYMILEMNYTDATIDKHVRMLNSFYKWAYPELPRTHLKYKWKYEESIITLLEDELKYLIAQDNLPHYQDITRDLFVFCCCTGMRYSDSQNFEDYWVEDGIIAYKQCKTGTRAIAPLIETANRILVKYGGTTPKISNPQYNLYLKELFEDLQLKRAVTCWDPKKRAYYVQPLFSAITTHVARKTFITLALARGVPVQDVMQMSGHNDFRAMRPYISIAREHIRKVSKILDW